MRIAGIGNALLDLFWFPDTEAAPVLGLHPNSTVHTDPDRMDELLLGVPAPIQVSGGSAANALKAASLLGEDCVFFGCLGSFEREYDPWAKAFLADLSDYGVRAVCEGRGSQTGRCLVINMPGRLASIACAPGAAPSFRLHQIDRDQYTQADWVFIDGQVLRNEAFFDSVVRDCRAAGIKIAVDAASRMLAHEHAHAFRKLLAGGNAVVFANEDEATALAGSLADIIPGIPRVPDRDALVHTVFSCLTREGGSREDETNALPCIVEKRGEKGARAWSNGEVYEAAAPVIHWPLDETAAGDTFEGAWLSAIGAGLSMQQALEFSNRAAVLALGVPGSRLDKDAFRRLKEERPAPEARSR